ncbi:MAG: hypothetical protein M1817_003821 [Caeruleum heppii]|nr:MAG: hypothetical protein M1817_003821 [Caeruleum heppii]
MSTTSVAALPYHEPSITTILIQSALLYALNVISHLLDRLIYCGLIGQVLIGVALGTPGAKCIGLEVENVIVQLGYLGLILLVYEGGLSTSFSSLKANAALSVAVAITGICLPVAFSFVLLSLASATPLQAFAAGAALCSTSLGTTFTVLSTSGLTTTRLGTVLITAAMMDDVVGLIMVQVISNLGASQSSFNAVVVIRPLAVSIGLGLVLMIFCRFVVRPWSACIVSSRSYMSKLFQSKHSSFVVHTIILVGLVAVANFAGTSSLYAAYLSGASICWWDSEVVHLNISRIRADPSASDRTENRSRDSSRGAGNNEDDANVETSEHNRQDQTRLDTDASPSDIYAASIGFSIPITLMFNRQILWRGLVFTVLMLFAKLFTGIWLVRVTYSWPKLLRLRRLSLPQRCSWLRRTHSPKATGVERSKVPLSQLQPPASSVQQSVAKDPNKVPNPTPSEEVGTSGERRVSERHPRASRSLYPAAIVGTAMTARGEIGFLIASIAESNGMFALKEKGFPGQGSSNMYLIIIWAIVLCTIIGPIAVGTLVKRVRGLQHRQRERVEAIDPLQDWGVTAAS